MARSINYGGPEGSTQKIYISNTNKKRNPQTNKNRKRKQRKPNKKFKSQIHKKDNAKQKKVIANPKKWQRKQKATTQTKKSQRKQKKPQRKQKATAQTKSHNANKEGTTQRQGGLGSILPFSRHFISLICHSKNRAMFCSRCGGSWKGKILLKLWPFLEHYTWFPY